MSLAYPIAREQVLKTAQEWLGLSEAPVFTFTLPNLAGFSEDFRQFVRQDLYELPHMRELDKNVINWSPDLPPLTPLATAGDGNCLLHAASLGMWGAHDRNLTMRA